MCELSIGKYPGPTLGSQQALCSTTDLGQSGWKIAHQKMTWGDWLMAAEHVTTYAQVSKANGILACQQ